MGLFPCCQGCPFCEADLFATGARLELEQTCPQCGRNKNQRNKPNRSHMNALVKRRPGSIDISCPASKKDAAAMQIPPYPNLLKWLRD